VVEVGVDPYRPGGAQCTDSGVRITRVDVDLFVLFKPRVKGRPLKANGINQARKGICAINPSGRGPDCLTDLKRMLSGSAAAEPLWMIFIDQDGGIDIGKWNVVLRILRPFPDVASRYSL
jgi:hypothetical protein